MKYFVRTDIRVLEVIVMPEIRGTSAVLKDGNLMPLLGLGCWQSPPGEVEGAVEAALDCGYRHIDTAYNYLNEEAVGKGIHNWLKKTGAKREEIFVVTKLPMIGMYAGGIGKFLKLSLKKLNLSYVDLYLVHVPCGMKQGKHDEDLFPISDSGEFCVDDGTDLIAVWKEMEKMVDAGLTRSIGVSNYNIKQMKKMNAIARIPPAVNQVEMNVDFQQRELVEFCNANNIVVTAYAPLGSPGRIIPNGKDKKPQSSSLLSNPCVKCISQKRNVFPAQILIKFLVQQGIVTIPKSVNPDRIKTNFDVFGFELNDCEIATLKLLDKGEEGRTFDFFRTRNHPECPI